MKVPFVLILTLGTVPAGFGFGQDSRPSTKDLHDYNRAIAFGSALMVTQGGADQSRWKSVEAVVECPTPPQYPSPPIGQPEDFADSTRGCKASVHFVTHYEFKECPNGRYYILRGGEGVFVSSAVEGTFFGWQEAASCDVSSPSDPHPEPGPAPAPPQSQSLRDKDRPLDFDRIVRTLR